MGSNSIAYCNYPLGSPSNLTQLPLEWYDHTTPTNCSMTSSFIHSIPVPPYSTTRYIGYLYLQETREYSFHAVFCTAIRVLIDYQQILSSTSYNNTHAITSSTYHLEAGYHLLQVFSIQDGSSIDVELYYSNQSGWHPIQDKDLIDGAVSPYQLQASPIVSYQCHTIHSSVPHINGHPCSYYHLQNELPSGLSFNSSTGVISGQVNKAGYYLISMTCYSSLGMATMKLPISIASSPKAGLQVTYYYTSGTFALSTIETSIDHPIVAVYDLFTIFHSLEVILGHLYHYDSSAGLQQSGMVCIMSINEELIYFDLL